MRWTEPKLFVLTRGRPEEAVLLVCKNHDGGYHTVNDSMCGWENRGNPDGGPAVCKGVTGT